MNAMARITPVDAELKEPLKSKMAQIFPENMPSPNLYRAVARNESLFIQLIDMGLIGPTGLLDNREMSSRVRELLILRTCVRTGNDYEFNLHETTISEFMGLTKPQIEDIRHDNLAPELWPETERVLMALVDELIAGYSLSDATFAQARQYHSEEFLIEVVQLIGLYTGVAMMVALTKPQLDPYASAG